MNGRRGSSIIGGAVVDLTGVVGYVFTGTFLIACGYDHGVLGALALLAIGFVGTSVSANVIRENFLTWVVGSRIM